MKITVLTGSARKKGTTALLADEFIRGAREAGHEVFRFDAAFEKVSPCTGCDICRSGKKECVYKDGMDRLNPELLSSDAVAFVTPLYYFGMSAQLKAVLDRFYASNGALREKPKKAVLLAACADEEARVIQALVSHYETALDYLRWRDCGTVLALGCGDRADIEATRYPADAYALGKNLD